MKQFALTLLLLCAVPTFSQEFKLGRVTKEELLEKQHPIDTSAAAAILHKRGKTFFATNDGYWEMVTEVEVRVKIYKKEGYKYASDKITYYSGGKSLKVYFSDAYTYNLVNGAIEKTKLKSEGEFEEKVNADFTVEKITMPNVKEGSVIEYKYVFKTPYFMAFRDWYFQYPIPVNNIAYEVAIPGSFDYNRYMSGFADVKISEPRVRTKFGYNELVTNYTAKNVAALKDESYVNNVENYLSILKHDLSSYTQQDGTIKKYSLDWQSVAKKVYEQDKFGKELKQNSYYEADLKALITPTMSQEAKMAAIFSHVQNRMAWNEDNDYLCDKGVKKAYADKTGNTAEINLMLVSMLRSAGFTANPVLVSTRANGVALFPSLTAYNYVIAAVFLNDNFILFDATSKYTTPGQLPIRALNWQGRLIRENGNTAEVNLMPKGVSKEVVYVSSELSKEGILTGKVRDQYFDMYAYNFRDKYAALTAETCMEKLEKRNPGMEVSDYKTINDKELTKPVSAEFAFKHTGAVDVIGNKVYINPMLFFASHENPFKQEKREYPVDFVYPHQDKYMINIKLPEGYVVESVPAPVSLVMEENIGSFKYNIVVQNNQMQLSVVFDINYANVSQDYYSTLKDFYRKMIEKQNEKIVLIKA